MTELKQPTVDDFPGWLFKIGTATESSEVVVDGRVFDPPVTYDRARFTIKATKGSRILYVVEDDLNEAWQKMVSLLVGETE